MLSSYTVLGTSLLGNMAIWLQILTLIGLFLVATVIIAILSRILRNMFRNRDRAKPSQHADSQAGDIQQAHNEGSGNITQVGRDYIQNIGVPTEPKPFTITVGGRFNEGRVILTVHNNSNELHEFKVRLHSVTGGMQGGGAPNLTRWLPKSIKWDSAATSEWEPIGPLTSSDAIVARRNGEGRHEETWYATVVYQDVGISPQVQARLYSRVPFGATIEYDIEILSKDLMEPYRMNWFLTLDANGMPTDFTQTTPYTPDGQS